MWLDKWEIKPGDLIPLKIQRGLEKSHTLLMCMSQNYFESEWGYIEHLTLLFRNPTNTQRRFIPLLITDCILPDIIAQFSYIDWRTHLDDAYHDILNCCLENNSGFSLTKVINQDRREEIVKEKKVQESNEKIKKEEELRKQKEEELRKQKEEELRKQKEEELRKQKEAKPKEEELRKQKEAKQKEEEIRKQREGAKQLEIKMKQREIEVIKKIEEIEKTTWVPPERKREILEEIRSGVEDPKEFRRLRVEVAKKKTEEQEKKLTSREINKTLKSPSTSMEFVLIPAGKYMMGASPNYQYGNDTERPYHEVTIKYSFYIGKYPVSQEQWKMIMGSNPSKFKGEDRPVESVSWNNVQEFIKKLNERDSTVKYRLPSETEWEYACRAGTTTRFFYGDDESKLKDYAWYSGYHSKEEWQKSKVKIHNSGTTHLIGQKKPNSWGLFDMHGNVWEWCQDKWHDNYDGAPSDGSAWESGNGFLSAIFGSNRVYRGGSWRCYAESCTSVARGNSRPDEKFINLGFRIVRDV